MNVAATVLEPLRRRPASPRVMVVDDRDPVHFVRVPVLAFRQIASGLFVLMARNPWREPDRVYVGAVAVLFPFLGDECWTWDFAELPQARCNMVTDGWPGRRDLLGPSSCWSWAAGGSALMFPRPSRRRRRSIANHSNTESLFRAGAHRATSISSAAGVVLLFMIGASCSQLRHKPNQGQIRRPGRAPPRQPRSRSSRSGRMGFRIIAWPISRSRRSGSRSASSASSLNLKEIIVIRRSIELILLAVNINLGRVLDLCSAMLVGQVFALPWVLTSQRRKRPSGSPSSWPIPQPRRRLRSKTLI